MMGQECTSTNRQRQMRREILFIFATLFAFLCVAEVRAANQKNGTAGPAAAPTSEDVAKIRIIIVSNLLEQGDIHPIEQTIVAQLADLEVSIDFHHVASRVFPAEEQDALAKMLMHQRSATAAFIITRSESQVILRILLESDTRVETTSRVVDMAPDTPLHEVLAIIVRAATVSVLERGKAPAPAAASPPKKANSEPKSPKKQASPAPSFETEPQRLYIEGGVALGMFSKGIPPWVGMAIALGGQPVRNLHLFVGYVEFSKVSKSKYDVALTLRRHPIHIGVGYWRPVGRFWLGGGASLSVDYVTESSSTEKTEVTLAPVGAETHLAVVGFLHVEIRLVSPLSFVLHLGAEVPVSRTKYMFHAIEQERALLSLLPVQPFLRGCFRIRFF